MKKIIHDRSTSLVLKPLPNKLLRLIPSISLNL